MRLERRTLLSTVTLLDGVLTIEGTAAADTIYVTVGAGSMINILDGGVNKGSKVSREMVSGCSQKFRNTPLRRISGSQPESSCRTGDRSLRGAAAAECDCQRIGDVWRFGDLLQVPCRLDRTLHLLF